MTSRERVRLALVHKEADRIPFDLGSRSSAIEEEAYRDLKRLLGLGEDSECFIRSHAKMDREIMDLLRIDTDYVRSIHSWAWRSDGDDLLYVDKWNVPWRKRSGQYYYELQTYPLRQADHAAVLNQKWEPLLSKAMLEDMRLQAVSLYTTSERALFCDVIGAGVFERAWYLRGFEEFMTELITEKEFAHGFLEKILERQLEAYGMIAETLGGYIEGVWITDDLATQESLIVSKELYREMIRPYHKILLEFLAARNLKVVFHSCGAVAPLLDDLIDIGVEILHPVQVNARGMDTGKLKREYGKDLVFWGGGCDIEILQYGTTEEVRREVMRRIEDLAADGGFVFSPTHCIQPGTPPQNILAMAEELYERGARISKARA